MTERPGDRTTTGHSQHIGGASFARRLTVEPHQNLENVLQQSVRQSIQRAQDRSKDSVFRQPGCCPLFDAICDFARSTGSKESIPLLPSDHQSLRWCNQLSGRKRHINSWCCLARRTIALACRRCRTRGSLRACCDKLTCTARSGLLSLASHWTAPLHSRKLLTSAVVALSSGWARARTVTLLIFNALVL